MILERCRLAGILTASMILLLAACADDKEAYVERPVESIYNEALGNLQAERYESAASLFDEVERQHPYSVWATKSQLMAAYANYMRNKYDEAIVGLDRFIQLHPSNKDIPYAHYLKALCYYEQISDISRDQKMTDLARKTLRELITRYPNSKYARDAKLKYDLTEDHLAGKELEVGRYYHRQGQYLAAINRFKLVIENYQTTTHVPEALHRLAEAYTALGLLDEAKQAAAVLGHNYPGSDWYVDSYELLKGRQVRPTEDLSWYEFWRKEDRAQAKPLHENRKKALAPDHEDDDSPGLASEAPPPPRGGPWWKLW